VRSEILSITGQRSYNQIYNLNRDTAIDQFVLLPEQPLLTAMYNFISFLYYFCILFNW